MTDEELKMVSEQSMELGQEFTKFVKQKMSEKSYDNKSVLSALVSVSLHFMTDNFKGDELIRVSRGVAEAITNICFLEYIKDIPQSGGDDGDDGDDESLETMKPMGTA